MALVNKPYTFSAGATIVAAEHNSNFDTIYNDYNGGITNANISGSANITDSKLAQLTTAGKVSGASLTLLGSTPSGGGVVPIANLATGTPTGAKFIRDDGTLQSPVVSGNVLQMVNNLVVSFLDASVVIPVDNTTPLITEGVQVLSKAITASDSSNLLRVDVVVLAANNGNGNAQTIVLFQDTTCVAVTSQVNPNANYLCTIPLTYWTTAGSTSSQTFTVRLGPDSGTTSFNGKGGSQIFNSKSTSTLTITEIKA